MNTRLIVICAALACAVPARAADPPFYADKTKLLVYLDGGKEQPVRKGWSHDGYMPRIRTVYGYRREERTWCDPPPDVLADLDAVLKHVASGTPIEPELARRVRERSESMTEELRRKYGEINVAVDLIREIRDEE
jgi:hypothetical protein